MKDKLITKIKNKLSDLIVSEDINKELDGFVLYIEPNRESFLNPNNFKYMNYKEVVSDLDSLTEKELKLIDAAIDDQEWGLFDLVDYQNLN